MVPAQLATKRIHGAHASSWLWCLFLRFFNQLVDFIGVYFNCKLFGLFWSCISVHLNFGNVLLNFAFELFGGGFLGCHTLSTPPYTVSWLDVL